MQVCHQQGMSLPSRHVAQYHRLLSEHGVAAAVQHQVGTCEVGKCPQLPLHSRTLSLLAGAGACWGARAQLTSRRRDSCDRQHSLRRVLLHVGRRSTAETQQGDDYLPSDDDLRRDLNAQLPAGERIRREAAFRAEQTLKRADEQIAKLGIDLESIEKDRVETLSKEADETSLIKNVPMMAVCGPWSTPSGYWAEVGTSLRNLVPADATRWLNLEDFDSLSEEEIEECLKTITVLAICPGFDVQAACSGLSALMKGLPESVTRVVLLSIVEEAPEQEESGNIFSFIDAAVFGRQKRISPMQPIEDILTRTARQRSANILDGPPIDVTIIRAMIGSTNEPPTVLAKMPTTVRDATSGLRSMYIGGRGSMTLAEEVQVEAACTGSIASALAFAAKRGVDVLEFTVMGCSQHEDSEWAELMLPLMGPEILRLPVEDPAKARQWIKGWVEFNFCRGANQGGTAMRRAGLRTPVEVRQTQDGACLKFLPAGTRKPGTGFDGLEEGGLEIIIDDANDNIPGRIRVRRCAYGRGKKPRETSERTILSRLRRDWEMTRSFSK